MFSLQAKTRNILGKKVETLRKKGLLPAVLYGHKIKNKALVLSLKEFEKAYKQVGESSMISLQISGDKDQLDQIPVLIKAVSLDPVTDKFLHADFYQPVLGEKLTVSIFLAFEGESPAVKTLGAILIKNISEVEIHCLPQFLPKEIKVDVSVLETLEDNIRIKDLKIPDSVEILKEQNEIVASVALPEKEIEGPVTPEASIQQEEDRAKSGEGAMQEKEK